jgi:hypothetical protein
MKGEEVKREEELIAHHPPNSGRTGSQRIPTKGKPNTDRTSIIDPSAAPTRNTNCKQLLHILSWTYSTGDPICSGLYLP